MSIQGTAAIDCNITETVATSTGSATQLHQFPALDKFTVLSTDKIISISGFVGVTAIDIDLNNLVDASGADFNYKVVKDQGVDYATLKMIIVINEDQTVKTLDFGSPAANSLFTWNSATDFIRLDPTTTFGWQAVTAKTIGANGKINLQASALSTNFKVYIVGT